MFRKGSVRAEARGWEPSGRGFQGNKKKEAEEEEEEEEDVTLPVDSFRREEFVNNKFQ